MQYLVSQLEQNEEGITVNLAIEGEMNDLPSDMEIAVYRMLQESLNNIKKHAEATQVNVLAKFTPRQVKLIVQDNGQGFEVPETVTDLATQGSFGVMGLHERAQLLGGTVTIISQPGDGTSVEIVLPRYASPRLRLAPVSAPAESQNGANKSATPEAIPEL
jgi:signal transduction histidine kinase